jgi:hypothetical protein
MRNRRKTRLDNGTGGPSRKVRSDTEEEGMSDVTLTPRIAGWLCLPLFITFLVGGTAQGDESLLTIEFHGIRPTDPGGRVGLCNPERGFRIETLIAEPPDGAVWGPARALVLRKLS